MNPEMCQEGLDWDTKGGFVEWGALFSAFSLGSFPCVYKGAKNDINSFMHGHFDIFVPIHTHFAVFSPPAK